MGNISVMWHVQGNTGGGGPHGGTSRYFVVFDDNESGPYSITASSVSYSMVPIMSPDGKHYAIVAGDGTNAFVVADGKKQGDYDVILGFPVYSPDGNHLAYFASKDVLKNATPIARQQAQSDPNFDPGKYVVLDGQEKRLPPKDGFPTHPAIYFSPDGQHSAYMAGHGMVVDGRMVKSPATGISVSAPDELYTPTFSPDSKHIIFAENIVANGYGIAAVDVDGDIVSDYCIVGLHLGVSGNTVEYHGRKKFQQGEFNHVSVDLGPDRNFGTVDTPVTATTPKPTQAPTPPSAQNSPVATPTPPVVKPPKNATDTVNKLKNLFGN